MRSCRLRFALLLLILQVLMGAPASALATPPAAHPHVPSFFDPFLITFDRHDEHVIVFLTDHPEYESIEAMVTRRPGKPPLIRAMVILHDGFQIEHYNDLELARDRAAIFTDRLTVYRPIQFVSGDVNGVPVMWLQFSSYRGEDISVYFEGLAPPSPSLGGFINPGSHAASSSLPVMWANASSLASDASEVTIDAVPFALGSPTPGVPDGIYTRDFRIGVLRAGHLELLPISAPRSLDVGEKWLYLDQRLNLHIYEILAVDGEELTIHRTTTSPALTEEILRAEIVADRLELRSIRATGRRSGKDPVPPAPAGLTLDLSTPGSFSLSLDEHAQLITGTASREQDPVRTVWSLQPVEPAWATNREVTATVTRQWGVYVIDNEVGAP